MWEKFTEIDTHEKYILKIQKKGKHTIMFVHVKVQEKLNAKIVFHLKV